MGRYVEKLTEPLKFVLFQTEDGIWLAMCVNRCYCLQGHTFEWALDSLKKAAPIFAILERHAKHTFWLDYPESEPEYFDSFARGSEIDREEIGNAYIDELSGSLLYERALMLWNLFEIRRGPTPDAPDSIRRLVQVFS